MRVGVADPPTGRRNSFHSFVPTGNVHSSMSVVAIVVPGGR